MEDKIVEVIDQIDMSDLELPSFAIYKNPKDYPGKAVARLFEKEYPTDVVIIKKTSGNCINYSGIAQGCHLCRRFQEIQQIW